MNFSVLSFGLFGLKIYGVFVAIAFVFAAWHFYKVLQKEKLAVDVFLKDFWKWVLSAVIVGRLFSLAFDWSIVERNGLFSLLTFWDGELNFYGALLGFMGSMWWSLYRTTSSFLHWVERGIPSFLLAIMIVDLAGFFTGARYGSETVLPWGVQYETFGVDILKPTHPVALYAFALHGVLLWWVRRYQMSYSRSAGKMIFRAGVFFFLIDFLLQFVRGNLAPEVFHFFRIEQIFDIIIVRFLFWVFRVWKKK